MARKVIIVLEGQSDWDIALQEYGAAHGIKRLRDDNPDVNWNMPLVAGQQLYIISEPVDADMLRRIKEEQIRPVSAAQGEVILSVDSGFSSGFSIGFRS